MTKEIENSAVQLSFLPISHAFPGGKEDNREPATAMPAALLDFLFWRVHSPTPNWMLIDISMTQ